MSLTDPQEGVAFIVHDRSLSTMTAKAVSNALTAFPLRLAPGKDMEWLAMAVRRALSITLPNATDGPERTSNSDVRSELQRLAKVAGDAWQELSNCDDAADSRLWTVAWRHWDGEGGNVAEPADYRRFQTAVRELDWLSGFLRLAARETESPKGPWREQERKLLRIQRAQYLAPIFEAAFGQRATANNYGNDARHKTPTPFMLFLSQMFTLAFDGHETSNLAQVAKIARRRHRQCPFQFAENVIPGL